jgi:hypothetical protein
MNMLRALIVSALFCLAGSTAVAADAANDDATEADVRCVVVAMRMGSSDNPQMKTAGMIASMYFLGRVDSRNPDLDLETRIIDDLDKMTPEDLRAASLRCSEILTARGAALKSMGEDMIRKGQDEAVKKTEKGA